MLPKKVKIKTTKENDTPTATRNQAVPVNDPWIGPDAKANMTRVAENMDRKKELSKSARIIKALYKRKRMTEGKDPIFTDKLKGKNSKIDAAAILVGGKTMTGKDRDIIEIDPSVKNPKNGNIKK